MGFMIEGVTFLSLYTSIYTYISPFQPMPFVTVLLRPDCYFILMTHVTFTYLFGARDTEQPELRPSTREHGAGAGAEEKYNHNNKSYTPNMLLHNRESGAGPETETETETRARWAATHSTHSTRLALNFEQKPNRVPWSPQNMHL